MTSPAASSVRSSLGPRLRGLPARPSARRAGCGLDERRPAPPLARHIVAGSPGDDGAARRLVQSDGSEIRVEPALCQPGAEPARGQPWFRDCRPAIKNAYSTHQESAGIRIDFSAEPLKAHWGPAGCPSEASTAEARDRQRRRAESPRRRRPPPRGAAGPAALSSRTVRRTASSRLGTERCGRTRSVHFRRWRIRHRLRGSPAGRRSDPPMPRSQRRQFSVEMENRQGTLGTECAALQTEILANCRPHSRVARRLPMPRRRQRHFGDA